MTVVLSFTCLKPAEAVKRNCRVEIANAINGLLQYERGESEDHPDLSFSTPLRSALECLNAGNTGQTPQTHPTGGQCCRRMAERISSSYCNSKKTNTGNTNTVYDQNNGIYRRRHFVRYSS